MGFVRMNHAFGQRFRALDPGATRTKGAVDDMPEGELKVGHIKGHERTDLLVSLDEFLITND